MSNADGSVLATRDLGPGVRPGAIDDHELVERCAQGSELAWRVLVGRYTALVYSTALRSGLGPEDAADVFQLVWIQLYRSIGGIRNASGLPKWLVISTRRLATRAGGGRARTVRGVHPDTVDPARLPDERVESAQISDRLEAALAHLGGTCAALLRELYLAPERRSYLEVSSRVGVPVGSIGPMRTRGLMRLRRMMADAR